MVCYWVHFPLCHNVVVAVVAPAQAELLQSLYTAGANLPLGFDYGPVSKSPAPPDSLGLPLTNAMADNKEDIDI